MATTQAQRASLYSALAELMGTEDAETLMEQLSPSGWDNVATKDDLKVLTATFTAALAEMKVAFTDALSETNTAMQAGFAQAATERAEIIKGLSEGLAKAATERAELVKSDAEIIKSQAEILRREARNLYVTVSTIVLATISIWIALLAGPARG